MAIELSFPREGAVLVAGGGGEVGRAVVRRFAQAGQKVAFTYLGNAERAAQVEREHGDNVRGYQLDLRDSAATKRVLAEAADALGGLHTVIYTAGPTLQFAPVRSLPPEQAEAFLLGDAMCCYRLFHHAIPHLSERGGSLVACATMANRRVIDNDALSAMPKAAIESLIRQVAAEEAPSRIRCNGIAIGWIGGWAHSFEEAFAVSKTFPDGMRESVTSMLEQMVSIIRMKRPGRSDEAADLIAYLASEQASYVTGTVIPLDGGAAL